MMTKSGSRQDGRTREYYLDRIRVVLTAMVVLHHTAITYGAPGGWFYAEVPATISLANLPFVLFVSVNQAYFMGAFFLIAGYFAPASLERKGRARFLLDRCIRLGIPWMVFYFLLNPLCVALVRARVRGLPLLHTYGREITGDGWGNGPLWFAEALLLFCLGYAAWRTVRPTEARGETPVPRAWMWLVSALGTGLAALLLRQFFPIGQSALGLQIGYCASYIFLFALGTVARRRNWLARLTWTDAWPWLVASTILTPVLPLTAWLATQGGAKLEMSGGASIPAIVYALWEPLVAWGIIATYLVGFRRFGNGPSRVWEWLAGAAYAVYCVHAPVLTGVALLLREWRAAPMVKFAVVGPLAVLGSLMVSAVLLRIPGVRRVL